MILLANGTPLSRLRPSTVVLRTRTLLHFISKPMRNISEEMHRFIKTRLLMSILTCFQWGKDKALVQAVRRISKLSLTQRHLKVSQLSISDFINPPLSLQARTRKQDFSSIMLLSTTKDIRMRCLHNPAVDHRSYASMLAKARFSIPVGCTAASALPEEPVSQSLSPVTKTDAGTNAAKSSEENLGRSKEAHANDFCCRLEVSPVDRSFSSANGGTNSSANNCMQYGDPGGSLLDFSLKIFANPRNQDDKSGCCTVPHGQNPHIHSQPVLLLQQKKKTKRSRPQL
jgi:hypothetical protein